MDRKISCSFVSHSHKDNSLFVKTTETCLRYSVDIFSLQPFYLETIENGGREIINFEQVIPQINLSSSAFFKSQEDEYIISTIDDLITSCRNKYLNCQ